MRISECMTTDVQIVEPEQTIQEAAQSMAKVDAGILPVRENDRLIGMITDRDIAVRAIGHGKGPDTKIREVMSHEVRYCYDDEETADVLENMGQIQVRRLPVVNRDKRLVGIVSLSDLAMTDTPTAGEALTEIAQPSAQHSQTL